MATRRHFRGGLATLALSALVLSGAGVAGAAQKAVAGKNTCTITALAPTLAKVNLTGSASVVCTLATVVTLEVGVVELDGTVEDARVPIPLSTRTVAVTANKAVVVATSTLACLSTEAGNEEYATKARVNISGVVSTYDRTAPKNDAFSC